MERINIDLGWSRAKEAPALYFPMQGRMGVPAETVDLPDDCNISEKVERDCPDGSQVAYFKGNMAVYTKQLDVPADWEGKCVYLELDGAYCNTEITLNGHLIDIHPNGYAPFTCELTDYLNYGEPNRLAIFVNNSMMRTARWYSGTGIYRHVDLRVGEKLHLTENPLFVKTMSIENGSAELEISVEVENKNETSENVRVEVEIYEDPGHGKDVSGEPVAVFETAAVVASAWENDKAAAITVAGTLENAKLWDMDHPNLYVAKAIVKKDETVIDSDTVLFGVRTVTADAKKGLQINGTTVKIKGGCMHHDNGLLGAASFYDSEYRKLAYHKKNGYNGIRCAHNPMSRDMMEACDRLGLLVYAEAFDVWRMSKNANDYHLFFESWWERDLTAFMKRDRNHPSIIIWSTGNEIVERNGLKDCAKYANLLANKARELDPTRPISSAVPTLFNGMNDKDTVQQLQSMMAKGGPGQNLSTPYAQSIWADRTDSFCKPLDVVGYNYLDMRYESDHELYPDRVMCGTESYPDHIDISWDLVERLDYVIGDFVWTSQDYLGEALCGNIFYRNPDEPQLTRGEMQGGDQFPARTAHCSDFDICGNEMPSLAYRRIVWGSDETYIAVMNIENYGKVADRVSWAWDVCDNTWCYPEHEGHPINVDVYSAAEEVELIINGTLVGRQPAGKANRYKASFDTIYNAGEIIAISYTNGEEVSRQKLVTPGKPAAIKLIPEVKKFEAGKQSLYYVNIQVVDENGNYVPHIADAMTAEVTGNATLAAFGSGNHKTEELYTTGKFTSFNSRLLAILRSGEKAGEAQLTVKSATFGEATLTVNVED